jgi:hypothetical protein
MITWLYLPHSSLQAVTIYLILGLLGDNSEYVADANVLMPMLNINKVNMLDQKMILEKTEVLFTMESSLYL